MNINKEKIKILCNLIIKKLICIFHKKYNTKELSMFLYF